MSGLMVLGMVVVMAAFIADVAQTASKIRCIEADDICWQPSSSAFTRATTWHVRKISCTWSMVKLPLDDDPPAEDRGMEVELLVIPGLV